MSAEGVTYDFLDPGASPLRGGATHRVYAALREAIAGLKIQPGDFLDKQAIADRMGVSRFPVGEALNRLASEGLVDIAPQIGSRASLIRLADTREHMFIRRALEIEAIRALTATMSADRIRDMQDNLRHQQVAADNYDRDSFHRYDIAFHAVPLDALGHDRVRQAMDAARFGLDRVRRLLNTRRDLHITLAEHRAIAEALARRDTAGAAKAMETHLGQVMLEIETFARERPELFADLISQGANR
jgi:DNA-binding GntR family transcriptional regulator